uniref:Uncharacterized protein n=1 Tax=Pseudictyota dubia TaxID=2749911 RepID=A0A7R9ZGT0_9STRA|mmetsp:Transcript_7619/g.13794  ORF Transcript_7619/g.13794 Transcript_7619/m.13794 type:complete len:114 (+) Transcript_7619:101-442(+)
MLPSLEVVVTRHSPRDVKTYCKCRNVNTGIPSDHTTLHGRKLDDNNFLLGSKYEVAKNESCSPPLTSGTLFFYEIEKHYRFRSSISWSAARALLCLSPLDAFVTADVKAKLQI